MIADKITDTTIPDGNLISIDTGGISWYRYRYQESVSTRSKELEKLFLQEL